MELRRRAYLYNNKSVEYFKDSYASCYYITGDYEDEDEYRDTIGCITGLLKESWRHPSLGGKGDKTREPNKNEITKEKERERKKDIVLVSIWVMGWDQGGSR